MDNKKRMSKMGEVLKELRDGKIAVRYHLWIGPHTLEVAVHTPTDLDKAHTLLSTSKNTLGYDSVACIEEGLKLVYMF
jgi:hypothetical protein